MHPTLLPADTPIFGDAHFPYKHNSEGYAKFTFTSTYAMLALPLTKEPHLQSSSAESHPLSCHRPILGARVGTIHLDILSSYLEQLGRNRYLEETKGTVL